MILHVVAVNDLSPDELPPIPTLCLEGRIPFAVIQRYEKLFEQKTFIPCQRFLSKTPELVLLNWKERLLADFLLKKTKLLKERWERLGGDWEQ